MSNADPRTSSGPSEDLGRLLVRLRTDRGLAQKQVANLAEIDNSTLSRLESGDRGVSRDVLDRICGVLGLDRREQLDVLVAAGFLTIEAAQLLADEDLSRLARLLLDPAVPEAHSSVLRQYVALALAHAHALGYEPG
jgi:transcriptional regulator with XRE-family HTH domain